VRYRDLKKTMVSPYPLEEVEAARILDAQLKSEARNRRAKIRDQKKAEEKSANRDRLLNHEPEPEPHNPSKGLKRGPKPDPNLQRCEHGLHTQLTKREYLALEVLRKKLGSKVTRSTYLRHLICQVLEKERRKDCLTQPFFVDLENLHEACRRGCRTPVLRDRAPRLRGASAPNLVLLQTSIAP
jgi:hypothetical protein